MKEILSTLVKSRAAWSIATILAALALLVPLTLHGATPTAQGPAAPPTSTPATPAVPKPAPPKPSPPEPQPPAPAPGPPQSTTPATPPAPTPTAPTTPSTPAAPAVTTPSAPPPAAPWRPQTVVSLTFDDGNADQLAAATAMNSHNIDGTFFVVSGYVGASGYFSRADLTALAAAGHEIGGHSVNHPDLAPLPVAEVQREVCNDRVTLSNWGFAVRSFAYPFASSTPETEAAVGYCGYNSARMLGDIRSRFGCPDCDYAETLPPENPYYTRALDQVDSTWTLQDLKNGVLNAERTGGWVQYTFHNICASSCGELGISQAVFSAFLDWLAPRAATMNTVTKPVGDAVGGPVKPLVNGPAVTPPMGSTSGVVNPGLEDVGSSGVPACWFQAPYGEHAATFSLVSPGHTGSVANRVTMSGYVSGDAKLLPTFDLGTCAPSVLEGHSYSLRSWYTSSVVTQFAVYLRTTVGGWQYWTSSPWFAPSTTWTEAEWTTPVIPAGFNGISFGLNIFSDGELITDDHAIYDSVGAPPADPAAPTPPAPPAPPLVAQTEPTPVENATPSLESPAPTPPADEPVAEDAPAEGPVAGNEPEEPATDGAPPPTATPPEPSPALPEELETVAGP